MLSSKELQASRMFRRPTKGGPPGDRLGSIGSERIPQFGQREAAAVVLVEEAERGQRPKQPVEGVRVCLRCRGELVARSRAVGQQVGDPEHRSDMDRLRQLVRVDEPAKLGRAAQIVLNCSKGWRQLSQ
jgi:hypothetical protein